MISTTTRRLLVLATVLLGAGVAAGIAFTSQPTFVEIVPVVQLTVSVLTPFSTASMTHDLRDGTRSPQRLRSCWVAAAGYGLIAGCYVAAVTAIAVAVAGAEDPWPQAGPAVLGSLLVQLIPVGVGCAAGLLVPWRRLTGVATIVLPLTAVLLLRAAPPAATDWLTPLGAAGNLLPGPMTALNWAQWVVVFGLWVLLPNAAGGRRLSAG